MWHFTNRCVLQVGKGSTKTTSECLCNHMTTFSTNWFVPPNTIDFRTVFTLEKFVNSIAVLIVVLTLLLLYGILIFYARRADKNDIKKVYLAHDTRYIDKVLNGRVVMLVG